MSPFSGDGDRCGWDNGDGDRCDGDSDTVTTSSILALCDSKRGCGLVAMALD